MAKTQNRKHKRSWKNFLLDQRYQFRFVFWVSGIGLLLTFSHAAISYILVKNTYLKLFEDGLIESSALQYLTNSLDGLAVNLMLTSIVVILISGVWGFILSHRSAGPLYHFKRVFERIRLGDTSARVHLRPKDDFRDVANSVNKMLDAVVKKRFE